MNRKQVIRKVLVASFLGLAAFIGNMILLLLDTLVLIDLQITWVRGLYVVLNIFAFLCLVHALYHSMSSAFTLKGIRAEMSHGIKTKKHAKKSMGV